MAKRTKQVDSDSDDDDVNTKKHDRKSTHKVLSAVSHVLLL